MDKQDFISNKAPIADNELAGDKSNLNQPFNNIELGFFARNHMVFKAILISFLTLLLMIPMALIGDLIHERENTASEATAEVHQKWSGSQTIKGPVLTIPFYEITVDKDGKNEEIMNVMHILPETLNFRSKVETQELKRGLYEIIVYNTSVEINGNFTLPDELSHLSEDAFNQFLLGEAMLNIGISDLRGISEQIKMTWNGNNLIFEPGVRQAMIISSGVSIHTDLRELISTGKVDFSIKLDLKGSENLLFVPLGKTTTVDMRSNYTTPCFTGAFLPEERDIDENGFTGRWKVMYMNRNYPQVIIGSQWIKDMDDSEFGVELLLPVQHYQKSMRTIKYAILIIVLTFVISFFVEAFQKKRIHPLQYLLIGAALCLFYSLLISISEYTGFAVAYCIASVLTVTLITCYMTGILKVRKTALKIGGLLSLLYLCIYILIQMETYTLLAGSIGLFVILALIMYFSQRINRNA